MSFIVYLNDFSKSSNQVILNPRRSMSTGIRLAIHERGTIPDFSTGVSAGPGTETSISVTPVSRKRLGHPYHDCVSNRWDHGGEEIYSSSDCIEECLQKRVTEHTI